MQTSYFVVMQTSYFGTAYRVYLFRTSIYFMVGVKGPANVILVRPIMGFKDTTHKYRQVCPFSNNTGSRTSLP